MQITPEQVTAVQDLLLSGVKRTTIDSTTVETDLSDLSGAVDKAYSLALIGQDSMGLFQKVQQSPGMLNRNTSTDV